VQNQLAVGRRRDKEDLRKPTSGMQKLWQYFRFSRWRERLHSTNNIFMQYQIRSNHAVAGMTEIFLGQKRTVLLDGEFSQIHKVFLTPNSSVPFWCEPLIYGNKGFFVISSKDETAQSPDRANVSYLVFGNKQGSETPLWRELLSSAKNHEINGSYGTAIVELLALKCF
jgi:hypothetical protein